MAIVDVSFPLSEVAVVDQLMKNLYYHVGFPAEREILLYLVYVQ